MELSGIDVIERYSFDFNYPTYTICPKKENNSLSLISETEINILSRVCEKFKNYTGNQIASYMHKESAYINTMNDEIITFNYAKEIKDF